MPDRGAGAEVKGDRTSPVAISLPKAAAYLGVSDETFALHIRPAIRLARAGRRWLVPVSELDRWLAENAVGPSASGQGQRPGQSKSGSPKSNAPSNSARANEILTALSRAGRSSPQNSSLARKLRLLPGGRRATG